MWQARDLFTELYRILELGGSIIFELPDLAKCAQKALACEGNLTEYLEAMRGLYAFGWSSWHLKQESEKVGFRQVTVCDPKAHERCIWRDTRLVAVK